MKRIDRTVQRGDPLDFTPVIDAHGHFGPWPQTFVPGTMDREAIVAEMDRYGCDVVWMSASQPGYADDLRRKNDYVLEFAARYPDRIVPYCTLTANRPDRNIEELERCVRSGRCVGVKMHVYQQPPYDLKSDFLQPLLEALEAHRLVYMNHTLGPDLDVVRWATEKYPSVTFLSGHFSSAINNLATQYENLKDCTCASHGLGAIESEARRLGRTDTMLLGSDFGIFHLGFGIGTVAYAQMAEQDKRNILGLNALRVLERMEWFPEIAPRFARYDDAPESPASRGERA